MSFTGDPFGLEDFFSPEKKKTKSDFEDFSEPDMFADVKPFDAGFGFGFGDEIPDEIIGLENLGHAVGRNKFTKLAGKKLKDFRSKKKSKEARR